MEAVIMVLLSFFSAYGIVQLVIRMMCSGRRKTCEGVHSHRVLILKNCQENVEGLIRSMAWEDIRDDLIVVDTGSVDETPKLLRRLEREFDFLCVMTPEEYRIYREELLSGCAE